MSGAVDTGAVPSTGTSSGVEAGKSGVTSSEVNLSSSSLQLLLQRFSIANLDTVPEAPRLPLDTTDALS
jgi:hypothetical protein